MPAAPEVPEVGRRERPEGRETCPSRFYGGRSLGGARLEQTPPAGALPCPVFRRRQPGLYENQGQGGQNQGQGD